MDKKLSWCLKQKDGIKLVEPNENLSKAHMERAKSDLKIIEKQDKVWKVVVSYYAYYNAFYAVLLKFGIKCEIHSCTIHLLGYFENLKGFQDFLGDLKDNRTDTQYYLKEPRKIDSSKIKEFINLCELEILEFNQDKAGQIRGCIKENSD